MGEAVTTRRCPKCEVDQPLANFGTRARGGLLSYCKACATEYGRDWRKANPEKVRAQGRRQYARDPEKGRAQGRRQYARDPAARVASTRRYQRANPERAREQGRRNNASARLGRNPESIEYAEVLKGDLCSYCGGPAGTVDHIEPRKDGGGNEWDNLTAACASCNSSKGTRSLLEHLLVTAET